MLTLLISCIVETQPNNVKAGLGPYLPLLSLSLSLSLTQGYIFMLGTLSLKSIEFCCNYLVAWHRKAGMHRIFESEWERERERELFKGLI